MRCLTPLLAFLLCFVVSDILTFEMSPIPTWVTPMQEIKQNLLLLHSKFGEIKSKITQDRRLRRSFGDKFYTALDTLKSVADSETRLSNMVHSSRTVLTESDAESSKRTLTTEEKETKTNEGVKALATGAVSFITAYKKGDGNGMGGSLMTATGSLLALCPHPAVQAIGVLFTLASSLISLFNPKVKVSIQDKLNKAVTQITANNQRDRISGLRGKVLGYKAIWDTYWAVQDRVFDADSWFTRIDQEYKINGLEGTVELATMRSLISDWISNGFGTNAYNLLVLWGTMIEIREKLITKGIECLPPDGDSRLTENLKDAKMALITAQRDGRRENFVWFSAKVKAVDKSSILTLQHLYPEDFDADSTLVADIARAIFYEKETARGDGDTVKMDLPLPRVSDGDYFIETGESSSWGGYILRPVTSKKECQWIESGIRGCRKRVSFNTHNGRRIHFGQRVQLGKVSKYKTKLRGAGKGLFTLEMTDVRPGKNFAGKIKFLSASTTTPRVDITTMLVFYQSTLYESNNIWKEEDTAKYTITEKFRVIKLATESGKQPVVIGNPFGKEFLSNGHTYTDYSVYMKPFTTVGSAGKTVDPKFIWYLNSNSNTN